ncbi:uncharacterized protein TM35_000083960 [Trypanosoma theileri]|uniref:Uncharacterized protein n=1 Tax=Trypanosoma theileri TaxID=67003 RepID=A0A1X0P196_9TRYP|nr:uncharacterized protein TM35_000083960 [Trypanosoma theileri]ORC90598.1 hypothetical protein TM35_000083960 [Trypanosoma theileri]
MSNSFLSILPIDASLWWLVFTLCGAPVSSLFTAGLTFAFSLLVSATMPMKWMDVHRELLISNGENFTAEKEGNSLQKRKEKKYSTEVVQTFILMIAILFGTVFTQLDWAVWFQQWPFPAVVSYVLVRLILAVVAARGNRRIKSKE